MKPSYKCKTYGPLFRCSGPKTGSILSFSEDILQSFTLPLYIHVHTKCSIFRTYFNFKVCSIRYFNFARFCSSCLDLHISIITDFLCSLHMKADKFPWSWRNSRFLFYRLIVCLWVCVYSYCQQQSGTVF